MGAVTEAQMKELNRRFEDHVSDYRIHIAEDVEKHRRQDEMYEKNMQAISDLTGATKGVVDAWVFANTFQRFLKWLSAFGIIGIAIIWLITGKAPNTWF